MTTRTKATPLTLNGRKIGAVCAQLGSFATTWLFIHALGVTGLTGLGIALIAEYLLLQAKGLVLNGDRRGDLLGWGAIIVDTFLNAGGMWPYILRFDQTPSWAMLVNALGLDGDMRKVPALVIALSLGAVLSVLPHRLWREK